MEEELIEKIKDNIEYLEEKMNHIIMGFPEVAVALIPAVIQDFENLVSSKQRTIHMLEILLQNSISRTLNTDNEGNND